VKAVTVTASPTILVVRIGRWDNQIRSYCFKRTGDYRVSVNGDEEFELNGRDAKSALGGRQSAEATLLTFFMTTSK
jgi:hypothetical protein